MAKPYIMSFNTLREPQGMVSYFNLVIRLIYKYLLMYIMLDPSQIRDLLQDITLF